MYILIFIFFIIHILALYEFIYSFYFPAPWSIFAFWPVPGWAGARPWWAGWARAWGLRPGPGRHQQQIKGLPRVPSPNAGKYFQKSGQIGRVSFERQRGIRPGPGPRPGGWAGPGAAPGARTWRRTGPGPAPGPGPARPAPDLGISTNSTMSCHIYSFLPFIFHVSCSYFIVFRYVATPVSLFILIQVKWNS